MFQKGVMSMFKLETKELEISESLKKKIEIICSFANVKYELIDGSIISIKDTNLGFVRPHILKLKKMIIFYLKILILSL